MIGHLGICKLGLAGAYSVLQPSPVWDPIEYLVEEKLGEIRERDTIQAAMQATETSHLVLATLHAAENSAKPEGVWKNQFARGGAGRMTQECLSSGMPVTKILIGSGWAFFSKV